MIGHLWHQYWTWTGGNIGAMPMEALVGAVATAVLWPLLLRLWHRLTRDSRADAAAARRAAESAHRIAADLYEHHTGRPHPAAPAPGSESEAK